MPMSNRRRSVRIAPGVIAISIFLVAVQDWMTAQHSWMCRWRTAGEVMYVTHCTCVGTTYEYVVRYIVYGVAKIDET